MIYSKKDDFKSTTFQETLVQLLLSLKIILLKYKTSKVLIIVIKVFKINLKLNQSILLQILKKKCLFKFMDKKLVGIQFKTKILPVKNSHHFKKKIVYKIERNYKKISSVVHKKIIRNLIWNKTFL